MDRVDKFLLVMPVLPIIDLMSTLFSLGSGGEETGILARPALEQFGPLGLVLLGATASVLFLVFMSVVIRIKRTLADDQRIWWIEPVLVVPIYWFFVLEGVYISVAITNFLVRVAPFLAQGVVSRGIFVGAYFVFASVLTLPQMRELLRL